MKRFIFLLIVLCASGCGICRRCPKNNVTQVDSVYVDRTVITTVHDTTIMWRIPEESSFAVLADTDTSHLETGLAESDAWVQDGRLYHTIRNRSDMLLPISISLPMKVTETNRGLVRTRTVTVEVEKELTKWQRACLVFGKWAFVVLAILIMAGIIALVSKFKSLIR